MIRGLAVLALALALCSGCGRRITAPGVDAHEQFHAAEEAYWSANPNGSEPEFWQEQEQRYGLPVHFPEMVRCECGGEQ